MTREEAIARIEEHKIIHKMNEPRAIYISEALDMAIKALEQETCEDAISRQEAIDANCYNCSIKANGGKCSKCDAVKAIENLSSVKPQEPCDVPDTNDGKMSEIPTGSEKVRNKILDKCNVERSEE